MFPCNGVSYVLVYSVRDHTVVLHVCCCSCIRSSCGLVFLWFVFHVVLVKCGLVHSVRGLTVGFHVFVIRAVCC